MPTIPWRSYRAPQPDETYVVMASRLTLKQHRMVPVVMRLTRSIQAQLDGAPGLVGYALNAQVKRRTLLTLSVWESQEDLDTFAAEAPHAAVMEKLHDHLEDPLFVTWEVEGAELDASWRFAEHKLAEAGTDGDG